MKKALSFEEVSDKLPNKWDDYSFFAISPRHFEAIITKTCQILVEGYYDGILEPNKHYISVKKDFSNIDEVLEKIRDDKYITSIAECAYHEIYLNGKYNYKNFANEIEEAIESYYKNNQVNISNKRNFSIYSSYLTIMILSFSSLIDKILYQLLYKFCEKVIHRIRNYHLLIGDK